MAQSWIRRARLRPSPAARTTTPSFATFSTDRRAPCPEASSTRSTTPPAGPGPQTASGSSSRVASSAARTTASARASPTWNESVRRGSSTDRASSLDAGVVGGNAVERPLQVQQVETLDARLRGRGADRRQAETADGRLPRRSKASTAAGPAFRDPHGSPPRLLTVRRAGLHGQGVEHFRHARRRAALQVNRTPRPPQLGPECVTLRRPVNDERRLARGNPLRGLHDRQVQRRHLARQPRRQVQDLRPDAGIGQPRLDADADLQPVRISVAVFVRSDA